MTNHPLLSAQEQHPDTQRLGELRLALEASGWDVSARDYGPESPRVSAFLRRALTMGEEDVTRLQVLLHAAGRPHVVGGTNQAYDLGTVVSAALASGREVAYRTAYDDGLAIGYEWDFRRVTAYEMQWYWNFHGGVAELAANLASAIVVADLVGEGALQPLLGCVSQVIEL